VAAWLAFVPAAPAAAQWLALVDPETRALAGATGPSVTAPPGPPTWAEDFGGSSLDLSRWYHRASGTRHDGVLTPAAVSVGGGLLTIQTYTQSGTHYSGMISTQNPALTGFEQAFGYFEARIRFDSSPGEWSSFWLQSTSIGNPIGDPATAGVEMDVVEHRARCVTAPPPTPPAACGPAVDVSDRSQQSLIWDGYGPSSKSSIVLSNPLPGLGNGSWHTWALRWTPTDVTFIYDGTAIDTRTSPISQRSEYIVLSSEVGAFFAGAIPAGGYGSQATSTTKMQVDYVHVWASTVPENTFAPAISGTLAVGGQLTCSAGAWSAHPAPTFGYEWLSDGTPIAGATASSYTVRAGDPGHTLTCRVTATNTAGSATALSDPVLISGPPAPPPQPPPPPPPPPPTALLLAPPPPPPRLTATEAPDRTPPDARLSGRTSQKLGASVRVAIACRDEPCSATTTGTVRVARLGRTRATTYRLAATTRAIVRGATVAVRPRLPRGARAAIARAQRAGRRVVVKLRVDVADDAGNARTLTRQVALHR
jgi:beta-glucanase (GH16 family)